MPENQETKTPVETIRAADLIVTPPEPTAHVVANQGHETPAPAPAAAPEPAPAAPRGPVIPPKTDRAGVPFNPEKHCDAMHPKSGRWMPKKPKRPESGSTLGSARTPAAKPAAFSTVAPDTPAAAPNPEPAAEIPTDQFKIAAVGACTVLYSVGMTIGGDEWRPSDDEHANLAQSFEAYFRVKGITDLSPGWALAIALVAYAGPRFRGPKTVTTLQKIGGFFARIGAWWKARSVTNKIPQ